MNSLQRAPRPVPFFLGLQCLFGGVIQQVGWGTMAFGMVFALVFGSMINLPKEIGLRGELATVEGVVINHRETNATVNRSRALLGHGKLAQGTLISKEPTNQSVNEQTVYDLTFRFTPEGARREFTTVARTHLTEHLEDDEQESLLYDSRFPSDAVLLDNLPGKAQVGPDGRLQGGSFFGALGVLILPALSVLLTALTVLVMMPDA